MLRYHVLWFAFNLGCQSASVLITSILICYYNLMKTSFLYMNDYKYIHITNSYYIFSGSAIKRQDGLANTSCGFNGLSLSISQETSGWVFKATILQSSLVSNVLLPNLLSCSEFLWIARLKKIFSPKNYIKIKSGPH